MRAMFARLREDMAVVFDRDPAARSRWEVLTCYPGLARAGLAPGRHPPALADGSALVRALARPLGPLAYRDRDPSGRDHRPQGVHRPRNGRRHRRDGGNRRRLHALSRRYAGRDVLEQGEAPSDAGPRRGHRGGRQDTGPDPGRRRRQDRVQCRRRSRRAVGSDRRWHPGADHHRGRSPAARDPGGQDRLLGLRDLRPT